MHMYWILYGHFSAFANLRIANIWVIMFVCPSVRSSARKSLLPLTIFISVLTCIFKNLFKKFTFN